MATLPQLSIAPSINPMSGTGSDAHGQEQFFEFGDVIVGDGQTHWMAKAAQSVAIAIIAGIAVKIVWEQVK